MNYYEYSLEYILFITTTVTITFTEDLDQSAPLDAHREEPNMVAPSDREVCSLSEMHPNVDKATLHGKALVGSQHAIGNMLGDTQAYGSR